MNAADRAVAGSASAPLTKDQRSLMMRRFVLPAWRRRQNEGLAGEDLEEWRREEQFKACHRTHLRSCTQADWPLLCGHFLRVMGRLDEARRMETRALTGNLPVARRKLEEALREAGPALGDARAYAAAIARRQFKRGLDELTERQVWCLVFTVRNRARGKARKGVA